MLSKIICVCVVLTVVSGCASTYKPTPEFNKLSTTLDQMGALKVLSRNFSKSESQKGVCRSMHEALFSHKMGQFPLADYTKMEERRVFYNTWVTESWSTKNISGDFVSGTGKVTVVRELGRHELSLDLTNIQTVRIFREDEWACGDNQQQVSILVKHSFADGIIVQVNKQSLSEVLAAIQVLSSQAELLEGAGF